MNEISLNSPEDAIKNDFVNKISKILQAIYNNEKIPLKVKGTEEQVTALTNVLSKERTYMYAYLRSGNENPRTIKAKALLDKSIDEFKTITGIEWPVK